jgi:ATP-dependent helicase HrpB
MGEGEAALKDLKDKDLLESLKSLLSPAQRRDLEVWAPLKLTLKHGRTVLVHYEEGGEPWVESRLQDFFGMSSSPSLARGRVQPVLKLLAPNKRPLQVTKDLVGFWKNHYPAIRRELMRKYPRHKWPEDPLKS